MLGKNYRCRIVSVLDKAQFAGRAPLLIAVANMIEVCPSAVTGLLRLFLPRIAAAAGSQDFNTRKAAMETIETICLKVDGQSLVECKADMLACVDKCRYGSGSTLSCSLVQAAHLEHFCRYGSGCRILAVDGRASSPASPILLKSRFL